MVNQKCFAEMVRDRRGDVEEKPLYNERVKVIK